MNSGHKLRKRDLSYVPNETGKATLGIIMLDLFGFDSIKKGKVISEILT